MQIKSLVGRVSFVIERRLDLFDKKYSKNPEILLQFKIAVFYVNMC